MTDKREEKKEDLRLQFIFEYLKCSSGLKPDKWSKMINTQESKDLILKFFNTPTENMLTMQVSSAGVLIPALGIQPGAKVKTSYFARRQPVNITEVNYREMLIPGDMSPKPIEDFAVLMEEVYTPMLTNSENQERWPLFLRKDVEKRVHDMKNSIYELQGNINGETVLSMPLGIEKLFQVENLTSDHVDYELKSNIEDTIAKWSFQIKQVLAESSTDIKSDSHPLPTAEIEFWRLRLKNIESIYEQMKDPRVKKMVSLLQVTESPYLNSFEILFKNIIAAVVEARDIYLHLRPLQSHFEVMEGLDLDEFQSNIKPLMHCICLAWANSRYYSTSTHIITMLSQVVNMLITQASKFLDPSSLFEGDINDTLKKVVSVVELTQHFSDVVEHCRVNIESYFKPEVEPVLWTFHEKLIFHRLWKYETRLQQIKNIFDIVQDYMKLDRTEIGGLNGKFLCQAVFQIYDDFVKTYNELGAVQDDILLPENNHFTKTIEEFMEKINDYDRKLVTVFHKSFAECHTIEGRIKFIWQIGSIALRPILQSNLLNHYEDLLLKIHECLDNVKILFDRGMKMKEEVGYTPVDQYFPPVAGALWWLMKLKRRTNYPVESLKLIDHPVLVSQSAREIAAKYEELESIMNTAENEIFTEWSDRVPAICEENLVKTLFVVNDDRSLESNFDPQLDGILRETKYMHIMHKTELPQDAIDLFNRTQFFLQNNYDIGLIITWYNEVKNKSSRVEMELLQEELEVIDGTIDDGQIHYNWNSPETPEYVKVLLASVRSMHARVMKAQENVEKLMKMMYEWAMAPVLIRKDGKPENLLAIGEREARFEKRYRDIEAFGEEVRRILLENCKLYFDLLPESFYLKEEADLAPSDLQPEELDPDAEKFDDTTDADAGFGEGDEGETETLTVNVEMTPSQELRKREKDEKEMELEAPRQVKWKPYLAYIDQLVSEGLVQAVSTSICYILDDTDPEASIFPLFEVQLSLDPPDIVFRPPVQIADPKGFYVFYEGLMFDMMKMGTLIPRLDPEKALERENYGIDLAEDSRIVFMLEETCNRVKQVLVQAQEYAQTYEEYCWLWLDDRQEYLNNFLRFARSLNDEEKELATQSPELIGQVIKDKTPDLSDFKREIDYFMDYYKKCSEIENEKILFKWLRIDTKPFKHALLNIICKWAYVLKMHLVNSVNTSLMQLSNFLHAAGDRFAQPVLEDDYDGLLQTIYYLKEVRDRQYKIDDMFGPLKDIINLLSDYQVEFDDQTFNWLTTLPELWTSVKKLAAQVKQVVSPLLDHQVDLVKKRLNFFDYRQQQYLKAFHKNELFSATCRDVYEKLDTVNIDIAILEDELKTLTDTTQIFELPGQEFKSIKEARRELKLLKCLWDYVTVIKTSLDEWKTTLWKKLDVEGMDQECKKLTRELRLLDKDSRSWKLYGYIESQVKNMMSSLRAVSELQNPAIRERHWQQLMVETHVKFTMDDRTTLDDLLKLELHKYEEEVKNTVDKAVKEMAMEKTLRELTNTWTSLEFNKEYHDRTKLNLLKIDEETVEVLEDHQVQLQNMLSSRFVGYFITTVTDWQHKLSNADGVINTWFEVQRGWMHLESIFIGSEDIRNQLPEDSKRFEKIDHDFKDILKDMLATPNIVRATNKPNLLEKLEELQRQLNLCEKALANYLDTKRLAYPRFYFISPADLLDILSSGNNPELVCRHLSKLYDSVANLKWKIESGKLSKTANALIAKDGEEIDMYGTCDCSGKVEVWLNRVTDAMRRSVRYHFSQAVATYDEKPRELWIMDYQAQPALCGTQIWWTTEVNMAFARLEEGFENSMKDYQKKQINQLNALIIILCGELSENDRQKIMTICTIDVHARDVVAKLISMKAENSSSFQWQSQLRHRWDDKLGDCFANICDASFAYAYEYLGNVPRLVITPLTDRCYITLTQSLHLVMGGAPAGPAGTGKTETTKDLGRALGQMVYVFNCSEQMDYKSCGNIYKGLAQTGAWGCFDEFNRISVEVLSVVAVQVKCVLDGVKSRKRKFLFFAEELNIVNTVGMFITMNPGYAGRTELPENLKTLFRPCAMVVPDFELICEIMLVAEGFQEARLLARKFITLYTLCRELLSKQDHYDWGLRAIKSVLVVAGKLKRGDRHRPEDQVLMRALRDFNTPKIVTDDTPVFMGLIGDLFPALDVPRKRDLEFEKMVRGAAVDLKMQPEDGFILKVVQLEELFNVRHSVFIVGFAGTGKTQVWKTLFRTYMNQKRKPYYNDLNPKAVTNDELFGIINPATREWKDGLFSVLMRDQANMSGDGPKWIVFDGDIDPMWIESLNTVMDDNKVLTLASNERIALTKHMRLLFEISNLRTATPATVSRAGILYINPQDLGWNPYVTSWIDTRDGSERANLLILFDKYIPSLLEASKVKFKKITPIPEICSIEILCNLLDCFLTPENLPPECPKEWYELYFAFSCIWAFGSPTFKDQLVDWRNEFSKWWLNEFKTVKFPANGTVFDYFIDNETKKFFPWSERMGKFELDMDIPLQSTLVPTGETTRLRFFMDVLMKKRVPIMLVGSAGSGKSVIVIEKLASLPDNYNIANVPFNYYTTSEMLQRVLEKHLEKKAGRNYAPPGTKQLVYFVDDMNMPEVDTYGTVQPHTLIRQHMDYNHWYDRSKLTLKDIHNTQYVSCMNPTAGSFTIDPRLQRHFAVFAVSFPGPDALVTIYSQMLQQHLANPLQKFNPMLQKVVEPLINAALYTHDKVTTSFLPTAIKFHYTFNLRDLSNLFQGYLFANGETIPNLSAGIRLYVHEATRVYCDKLVNFEDKRAFEALLQDAIRKNISELEETTVFAKPIIYSHFSEGMGDPKYMPIREWPQLIKLLEEAVLNYNELVATMNLVMFEDAMCHVCRINRILESPRGNALLVGVGGSGKQSLSRLASFISSLEVFQVQLRKGYSISDLRADLAGLYLKAGLKNIGITFLMTDSQVAQERFLVVVNDMLASGEIAELFADDEVDNIVNSVRNEVKQTGMMDTKENCWKFFIDRVRRQLKCVLCFSPVGATLRKRARQFPALVNCTSINWFQDWPRDALESVSARFIGELEELPSQYRISVSRFMSYVHSSVNEISEIYLQNERRYNYTTPKSFLEQISLYSKLLSEKISNSQGMIGRLENGLTKLASCAEQVDDLKAILAVQEVDLKKKNEIADKILAEVTEENTKAEVEKAIVSEEEVKIAEIKERVSERQKRCDEDLAKAEPAVRQAEAALDTLNKNNLTELKSFGTPPEAVANVAQAVLVLFSPKGKVPKDRSWKACKAMMGGADAFLSALRNYDKENIHPDVVKAIQLYINDKEFEPQFIYSKSQAAAGLCSWVKNIMVFHYINESVKPLRQALVQANAELKTAMEKLTALQSRLSELQKVLEVLGAKMSTALGEKQKCQDEADATALTIDLANRLVNGLASEKVRWIETVASLKSSSVTIPGDVLVVTAFISYVGCFTRKYRQDLLNIHWLPFLDKLETQIPRTPDLDPLSLLTDDAQIAQWNNDGLPADRMSAENATILTNSSRWPLMIDPQLQGLKWIKTTYGDSLRILRLSQRNYLDRIEFAISNGDVVLLENIMESVDAVLDPILGRVLIKKGRAIKIGDKEVDFSPKFRLVLQTKLANPHYKPEMQAQTTLINFTVTKDGLEEQLLGDVVKAERPDLESTKAELTKQQNTFKITLKTLEDDLLHRLSSAGPNILSDVALVVNLETTKKTAAEIGIKVAEAKVTAVKIDEARECYRPAASRASLLYFILNDLNKINMLYQFSLKAFSIVFQNAIKFAEESDNIAKRVGLLIESITYLVFMYTSRGLFESDKLIFLCQMTVQILLQTNEILPDELDFLLRYPYKPNVQTPVDFLNNTSWGGIKFLSEIDDFRNLDRDIEGAAKRWKNFVESETPEREKFPQEWKNKTAFQRLCILRCLRLDRMTYGIRCFVEEKMGQKFVDSRSPPFEKSFEETSALTPVFFILSPGVDPLKDVEKLGKQLGFTFDRKNFHNVSLGQGQEPVAEESMDVSATEGHWVILQNVHLVKSWLANLEKKMEQLSEHPHTDYRLFISAEPNADPHESIIPQGILESAIKITNEPPTGIHANIHKALDNFTQATLDSCSKESEFKGILFALCYYHAVVAERRKFGPQGWNRIYPFNVGDLTISISVLYNYLESTTKVPWEDLRYLFGEIMYGGHITDDWDRRLCRTYLLEYLQPDLIDGDLSIAPGFLAPQNSDYAAYHQYVDDYLPPESPILYGLHPNAEIGFLTTTSENLFRVVLEMQPRDTGEASGGGFSREDKVKGIIEELVDKLPEEFNIQEFMSKVDDLTPYTIVAFQECERMNILCNELKRSLHELNLGLKGELTINADMEDLQNYLFMDNVPPSWTKRAYPSSLGLTGWFVDLLNRINELANWTTDFNLPASVWLGGFFNPQSFLTAIMQQTARKNQWPLDKMCLHCEVTKKLREDFNSPPREGAYINSLYMEGARWDTQAGTIAESKLKELFPQIPVVYIRAITQDKQELRNMYECPVYKTKFRGPTYVWTFNLKTKEKATKWTLAGVAILLQI
ncbi:dynein beta chain, ciliary-like [Fopius arisanus]|uniref:Dynein beta chain, ciliary-like n=1 Tax=Fopius arisanus TaxID=64838 RepID=A0A9R1UBH1_9HYME|nr:PREDICTED: dynein beta chain, ciliary-like [Fopius arisanus]